MKWVHYVALGTIGLLCLVVVSPVLPGFFRFIAVNPGIVGLVVAAVRFRHSISCHRRPQGALCRRLVPLWRAVGDRRLAGGAAAAELQPAV